MLRVQAGKLQSLTCSQEEWRYLLSGGAIKEMRENPAPDWLCERAWGDILALSNLKNFSGFADDFAANLQAFRAIFDSPEPHRQVSRALLILLYCTWHVMASLGEHEELIQPAPLIVPHKGEDEALSCLLKGRACLCRPGWGLGFWPCCLPTAEPRSSCGSGLATDGFKAMDNNLSQLAGWSLSLLKPRGFLQVAWVLLEKLQDLTHSPPKNTSNCFAESPCPRSGMLGLMPSRGCWFCGVCGEIRSPMPCRTSWR